MYYSAAAMSKVHAVFDSFYLKEFGDVNDESSGDGRKNVGDDSTGSSLHLPIMMRPTDGKISFYANSQNEINTGTKANPETGFI